MTVLGFADEDCLEVVAAGGKGASLARMAALGAGLQDQLGGPQDIEWAIEDGELYVLQCRPVTA